jgi:hypothetical protein
VLLLVDWLALRSSNQKWLLDLTSPLETTAVGIKNLSAYPNLCYGRALALLDLNRVPEARVAMQKALSVFPECALSIFTALV